MSGADRFPLDVEPGSAVNLRASLDRRPSLLMLNCADSETARTLAGALQRNWLAVAFDAEELAGSIRWGMPVEFLGNSGLESAFSAAARHATIQVAATLAHRFGLVVVPVTLVRRQDIAEIEHGLVNRAVDFAHVVVDMPTDALDSSEELAATARLLAMLAANAHLSTGGRDVAGVVDELVSVLGPMAWLPGAMRRPVPDVSDGARHG